MEHVATTVDQDSSHQRWLKAVTLQIPIRPNIKAYREKTPVQTDKIGPTKAQIKVWSSNQGNPNTNAVLGRHMPTSHKNLPTTRPHGGSPSKRQCYISDFLKQIFYQHIYPSLSKIIFLSPFTYFTPRADQVPQILYYVCQIFCRSVSVIISLLPNLSAIQHRIPNDSSKKKKKVKKADEIKKKKKEYVR